MRRRSAQQLTSPERLALLSEQERSVPRVVRAYVRKHFAVQAAERLFAIGMGQNLFTARVSQPVKANDGSVQKDQHGGAVYEEVEIAVAAPPTVQRAACRDLLDIAVPAQLGLSDDDGNEGTGVIVLPALDLEHLRRVQEQARLAEEGAQ